MLYVRYDRPKNLVKEEFSAYVSFKWSQAYVDGIKALPLRYWIPQQKEWEIPVQMVPLLNKIGEVKELNQIIDDDENKIQIDENEFKTKPFKHQLEGVIYGIEHPSWLLGDQQGLGKTKQMIDLAVWKKRHQGIKHCLIICCVNNLKYNWLNEIKVHSNESACVLGVKKKGKEPSMQDRIDHLKYGPEEFFWITNIESLRVKKDSRINRYKSEFVDRLNLYLMNGDIGMIVVDEIHKCKNSTSAQGRGLLQLKGANRVGLSGTLLVSKPLDLYTPLKFIGAVNKSQWEFDRYYSSRDYFNNIVGYQHLDQLQVLMDMNMLRRTKDLLDLPPKLEKIEYIELSSEERKLYNAIEQDIRQEIRTDANLIKSPASVLAKLTRLRQVSTHTGLVSDKVIASSKFERLKDILEEAQDNGEKVIVFTMFRKLAEMAMEEFKEYNPYHIWGQMNQVELQDQVNGFQEGNNFKVLFGVIQAAGTGITLNTASIVVFLDLPWDTATMEQAEDRAHRIGTKKTVTCIRLIAKDTYDERVWRRVLSKGHMSKALIDMEKIENVSPFIDCVFVSGEYEDEDTRTLW
jgi:SNF2 family DNA or RNA helicase